MFDAILPRLNIPAISGTILLNSNTSNSYPFLVIHQIYTSLIFKVNAIIIMEIHIFYFFFTSEIKSYAFHKSVNNYIILEKNRR